MARAKEKKKSHSIVNRIVGYGTKPADQFQANPMNWRVHPEAQRTALAGVLESVGWAAPVIENVRTGHLVDGHERVWQALQAGNIDVPYVQVDVSENEERTLLTTLDPIGALADTDREKLAALMADVRSDDARVQDLIAGIAARERALRPEEFDTAWQGMPEYQEEGARTPWKSITMHFLDEAGYNEFCERLQITVKKSYAWYPKEPDVREYTMSAGPVIVSES